MEDARFDRLARTLAQPESRRGVIAGIAAGAIAFLGGRRAEAAACRADNVTCTQPAQCCAGVCGPSDSRGRRTCGCKAGSFVCGAGCCGNDTGACFQGTCIPCEAGDDFNHGACFRIAGGDLPCNAACSGVYGNVDGTITPAVCGLEMSEGCTSTNDCPLGQACSSSVSPSVCIARC